MTSFLADTSSEGCIILPPHLAAAFLEETPLSDKPTCKTCKHWYQHNDGSCGQCGQLVIDGDGEPVANGVASRCPTETDFGALVTGPDYGCIHHEPKETAA